MVDDSQQVDLAAGATTTITLVWDSSIGDAGEWTAQVDSEDDTDTHLATVDYASWAALDTLAAQTDLYGCAALPDGRLALAPGTADPTLRLASAYTPGDWRETDSLDTPTGTGFRALAASDTHLVGAARQSTTLWLWDPVTPGAGADPSEWSRTDLTAPATVYGLDTQGDTLLVAHGNGADAYTNASGWAHDTDLSGALSGTTRSAALSPATGTTRPTWAAAGTNGDDVTIFDPSTWTAHTTLTDPGDSVWSLALTDDYLAAGTWGDGIYVYAYDAGSDSWSLLEHLETGTAVIRALEIDPTGRYLAAGTSADEIRIYGPIGPEPESGAFGDWALQQTFSTTGPTRGVSFSQDGPEAGAFLAGATALGTSSTAPVYDAPHVEAATYAHATPPVAATVPRTRLPAISVQGSPTLPADLATTTTPTPSPTVISGISVTTSPPTTITTTAAPTPSVVGEGPVHSTPTVTVAATPTPAPSITSGTGTTPAPAATHTGHAILEPPVIETTAAPAVHPPAAATAAPAPLPDAGGRARPIHLTWLIAAREILSRLRARDATTTRADGTTPGPTPLEGTVDQPKLEGVWDLDTPLVGQYIRDGTPAYRRRYTGLEAPAATATTPAPLPVVSARYHMAHRTVLASATTPTPVPAPTTAIAATALPTPASATTTARLPGGATTIRPAVVTAVTTEPAPGVTPYTPTEGTFGTDAFGYGPYGEGPS